VRRPDRLELLQHAAQLGVLGHELAQPVPALRAREQLRLPARRVQVRGQQRRVDVQDGLQRALQEAQVDLSSPQPWSLAHSMDDARSRTDARKSESS